MISRRRMVFQFTALLDLLLVVLFAQYLENYERAKRQARAEQVRRAQVELARQQAELDRQRSELERRRAVSERRAAQELRDTFINLVTVSVAGSDKSAVQKLRENPQFREAADVWDIYINADETVLVVMNGREKAAALTPASAGEFANQLVALARENGEPRKDVIAVWLTYSDVRLGAIRRVWSGIGSAERRLEALWGEENRKRIEPAELGYSEDPPKST